MAIGTATALAVTNPTLLDVARRLDPDGTICTDIVELIAQTNELMPYITFKEGNLPDGHKTTIRTGYPTSYWKKFYRGILASKSTTQQVTDTCGMLRGKSDVDVDLANLSGANELRTDEDQAAVQGMTEEFVQTFFYGNTDTSPEEFMGLSPRFNTPATANTYIGYNMVDGGADDGQTDTTSVWLLGFSPTTLFGIFPKGSKAGLRMENKGKLFVPATDDGGNTTDNEVYRTMFYWDCGLCVRDWRYVVRICNIDTSSLIADPTGATVNLVNLMISARAKIPIISKAVRLVWCMNKTVQTLLWKQMNEASKYMVSFTQVGNEPVMNFMGIPIARCDGILNTETAILDATGTFSGD